MFVSRGKTVERHVNERGVATCSCGASGPVAEALPLCAAGFVDVDVRID